MTPEKIQISPASLEQGINESKQFLNRAGIYDHTSGFRRTNPSRTAQVIFSAIEHCIGTYLAVREAFLDRQILDTVGNTFEREGFIETYAMYIGAVEGLSHLQSVDDCLTSPVDTSELFRHKVKFTQYEHDANNRKTIIVNQVLRAYNNASSDLRENEWINNTYDFFEWLIALTLQEKQSSRASQEYNRIIKGLHIDVNGNTFSGFGYKRGSINKPQRQPAPEQPPQSKKEAKIEIPPTPEIDLSASLDDVVGNSDLKRKGSRAIENVLTYKPEQQGNVLLGYGEFPRTYSIVGPAGTGKTSVLKALAAKGHSIAAENQIPFRVRVLTSASFKDQYFAKSAQNLRAILDEMQRGDCAYLLIIEDFTNIFFSQQGNGSEENKAILGELLNGLEGVATKNLGNYLIMVTSNNVLEGESALVQRLRENTIYAPGPQTAEDYVKVFQVHLGKSIGKYVILSDREWSTVGKQCVQIHDKLLPLPAKQQIYFTGRDIKNICREINDRLFDFDKPPGWYRWDTQQQDEYMAQHIQAVGYRSNGHPGVRELIDNYVEHIVREAKKEMQRCNRSVA